MAKKNLNPDGLLNELRGGSSFFPTTSKPIQEEKVLLPTPNTSEPLSVVHPSERVDESKLASNQASLHASTLAGEADFKSILKTLKFIGKEVLYVRLTPEEKNQVNEIEYTYQRQGIKTSGNEIGRIALNVLLDDYKVNGEQSILAKMLGELHT